MRRTYTRSVVLALLPAAVRPYLLSAAAGRGAAVHRTLVISAQEAEPEPDYIPALDGVVPPEPVPLPGLPRRFSKGTGPFSTSHGVPPEEETQGENYLAFEDWHVSASYTPEQLAEKKAQQKELEDLAAGRVVVEVVETEEEEIERRNKLFSEKEFQKLEHGDYPVDAPEPWEAPAAQTPMPSSWQEFQFLQESVARYSLESEALPVPEEDRATANDLGVKLAELYPTFKKVIEEGWDFEHDPDVEAAGLFTLHMRKWEAGLQKGKKRVAAVEQAQS